MTAVRRQIKNVVGNYSDVQVKVREATSNDPWGPSGALMSEIADATYSTAAFQEIVAILWRRLNDHGKYWRHVYKALTVLEYIVRTGSDGVIQHCHDNLFAIQTLKDFQFIDKEGKDQGINVREKSKNLVGLLKDKDRLEEERRKGKQAKQRFATVRLDAGGSNSSTPKRRGSVGNSPASKSSSSSSTSSTSQPTSHSWQPPRKNDPASQSGSDLAKSAKPRDATEEALQLELAMALSREQAEKDKQIRDADVNALTEALSQSRATTDGTTKDPWGSAPPPSMTTDPWGGASSGAAPALSDPFGSAEPWGSAGPSRQPAQSASPWGTESATAPPTLREPAASPWGKTSPAPSANPWASSSAPPPANDPFNSGGGPMAHMREDFSPTSDFGSSNGFSPRSSPFEPSAAQPIHHGDPFSVSQTLASVNAQTVMQQSTAQNPATVEKQFLGQNSMLVNLDSLAGVPPPANISPALSNPFMAPGVSSVRQLTANPFQKDKPQPKSLNQMRTQDFSSGSAVHPTSAADLLPAPLIPDSTAPPKPAGPIITPGPTIPPSGWGSAPMAPTMQPGMMGTGMAPMGGMGYSAGVPTASFGANPPVNSRNPFQQW